MLLVLRLLYGIGMGGEWGLGAALAMEKIPAEKRGFFSGVLQQGYSFGYLLAAVVFLLIRQIDIGHRQLAVAVRVLASCRRWSRSSSGSGSASPRSGRPPRSG